MDVISSARGLLLPGDKAIVLKTCGDELVINHDNTGRSGNWKFQPYGGRRINKVIIFLQREGWATEIFTARYKDVEPAAPSEKYDTPGRYVITMTDVQRVGLTRVNWKQFAEAGTNPVRFLP